MMSHTCSNLKYWQLFHMPKVISNTKPYSSILHIHLLTKLNNQIVLNFNSEYTHSFMHYTTVYYALQIFPTLLINSFNKPKCA